MQREHTPVIAVSVTLGGHAALCTVWYRLALAVALVTTSVTTGAPLLAAPRSPTSAERRSLEKSLERRGVTARIDLPLLRGLRVFPDGNIDLDDYRGKLRLPPSLLAGDRAVITSVSVKGDKIEVELNEGGRGGIVHEGHVRWMSRGTRRNGSPDLRVVGSRLDIIFDRRLTGADVRPEAVIGALANLLEIEGLPPATAAPLTPAAPAGAAASQPVLELMGAEVRPTSLKPGQTVELVMRLEVRGLAPGGKLAVAEERQLFFTEKPLFSEPRVRFTAWGNGIHTTTLSFDVPATAPPGVYTFVGTLRSDLGVASRDALFVIKP